MLKTPLKMLTHIKYSIIFIRINMNILKKIFSNLSDLFQSGLVAIYPRYTGVILESPFIIILGILFPISYAFLFQSVCQGFGVLYPLVASWNRCMESKCLKSSYSTLILDSLTRYRFKNSESILPLFYSF